MGAAGRGRGSPLEERASASSLGSLGGSTPPGLWGLGWKERRGPSSLFSSVGRDPVEKLMNLWAHPPTRRTILETPDRGSLCSMTILSSTHSFNSLSTCCGIWP